MWQQLNLKMKKSLFNHNINSFLSLSFSFVEHQLYALLTFKSVSNILTKTKSCYSVMIMLQLAHFLGETNITRHFSRCLYGSSVNKSFLLGRPYVQVGVTAIPNKWKQKCIQYIRRLSGQGKKSREKQRMRNFKWEVKQSAMLKV